jgi:hypothetical protein
LECGSLQRFTFDLDAPQSLGCFKWLVSVFERPPSAAGRQQDETHRWP